MIPSPVTDEPIERQAALKIFGRMDAKTVSNRMWKKVAEAPGCEQVKSTDEELVTLILAGDEQAFAELYERYHSRAYRLAYAMTGRHEAAEDLMQEIFLRLYEKLSRFSWQARFSTWFYRLAVNRCLNYRQREQIEAEEMLADDRRTTQPIGGLNQMEARILQQQISDQVHRALLSLKPRLRLTVILKEIEGLNYAEIAERMGCPEGTVASRLNRARKLLARKLEHLKGAF